MHKTRGKIIGFGPDEVYFKKGRKYCMKFSRKCFLIVCFSILLSSFLAVSAFAESVEVSKYWYYGMDLASWYDGGYCVEWHSENYKKNEIVSDWEMYRQEFGDLTDESLQKAYEQEKADIIEYAKSHSDVFFQGYAQLPSNAEVGASATGDSTIYWYTEKDMEDARHMDYEIDFDTGVFTYEDGRQIFPVYIQNPRKSFGQRLKSFFLQIFS